MHTTAFGTSLVSVMAIPTICFALSLHEFGNHPLNPENYKTWPGIVKVVNQPSREKWEWCNGGESSSFSGKSEDLNAALRDFAMTKCSRHPVVFRPGPLHDGRNKYDWLLNIAGGLVGEAIILDKTELVDETEPIMVVYVSDKLKLDSIVIPQEIEVLQISDLHSRYKYASSFGNDKTRARAVELDHLLDNDPLLKDQGHDKYQARLNQIEAFVKRQNERK